MSLQRRNAVRDQRIMIRVRNTTDGHRLTAAVCPGCWHTRARRKQLLEQLARNNLQVLAPEDRLDGRYQEPACHAPACPYAT